MMVDTGLQPAAVAVGAVFLFLQAALAVYGLHRYWMVALFYRHRRDAAPEPAAPAVWPVVTVQLPVHNEIHVIERLVDAVCALDYPRDRLEIQILDDSTDETTALAEARAAHHRAHGLDVRVWHRERRDGFKAGALAAGTARARGELLAVFDADFLPPPDFLRRTVPHFAELGIGMVQTRWGHVNRDYSRLTGLQAVFLDSHFLIEHGARHGAGRFFNFNGTAGVWRRSCIETAGGWQADTLTEDLDLSYRAQIAGWRFRFLPEVVTPAELPVDINAFKSQQRRWAKGSIQTALKVLPTLWRGRFPVAVKLEAFFHLTSNVSYLLFLVSALLLPVLLLLAPAHDPRSVWFWGLFFVAGTVGVCVFFAVSQLAQGFGWGRSWLRVPGALALGMGMSWTNARAVLEALAGHMGDWERTPKFAVRGRREPWRHKRYAGAAATAGAGEAALVLYFASVVGLALVREMLLPLPFLALLLGGLGYVAWLSAGFRRGAQPGAAPEAVPGL